MGGCIAHARPALAVGLHMAYLARIGGDHFEFRPMDFYWLLLALPAAEGLVGVAHRALGIVRVFTSNTLRAERAAAAGLLGLFLLYFHVPQAALLAAPDAMRCAPDLGYG